MTKARDLLLAGSMLPLLALVPAVSLAAESGFVVAQAAPAAQEDPTQKGKQAPKKEQPPTAKQPGQREVPAARGQPPSGSPPAGQPSQSQSPADKRQPPAAQGQPPSTQQPSGQTGQPQRGQPPAARSAQPPTETTPPARQTTTPSETTTPGRTPAARTPPPAGQPGQPPAARRQPLGQPPASQTQTTPPARETQPSTAQQPAQTQPAQTQPDKTQPTQQPPAARRGPPGSPPAAQGRQAPGQPTQQQPAARTEPAGQPPAAQDQTTPPAQGRTPAAQGQPPAGQGQAPFAKRQPGDAFGARATGSQGQPIRRVEELRQERREERQGDRTVIREGDRTIIRQGDRTIIQHSETNRFRHSGRELAVERRGGEVRTAVERPDGTRIITVTDDSGRLLRRMRRTREGREIVIIDNRVVARPGARADFFVQLPPPVIRIPRERYIVEADRASREEIYETLIAPPVDRIERRYSLDEVRYSPALRQRMPRIDIDSITFESGSWEIAPDQIDALAVIGEGINRAIARNPNEVFMIEGHTDATGPDDDNLSLSDRRAESVALALSEQFQVPAENLTTQGYGEQQLKVPTEEAERQNRRVTLVRITPLLSGKASTTGAN